MADSVRILEALQLITGEVEVLHTLHTFVTHVTIDKTLENRVIDPQNTHRGKGAIFGVVKGLAFFAEEIRLIQGFGEVVLNAVVNLREGAARPNRQRDIHNEGVPVTLGAFQYSPGQFIQVVGLAPIDCLR